MAKNIQQRQKKLDKFSDDCELPNLASRGILADVIEDKKQEFAIYPNPSKDFINVNCDKMNNVEIIDIIGNIVLQQNCYLKKSVIIDIHSLKSGIYVVKVFGLNKNFITYKFIKQ